jgi:hypothetical protein
MLNSSQDQAFAFGLLRAASLSIGEGRMDSMVTRLGVHKRKPALQPPVELPDL